MTGVTCASAEGGCFPGHVYVTPVLTVAPSWPRWTTQDYLKYARQMWHIEPGSISDFEPGSIANFEPGSISDFEPGSIANFEPGSISDFEPGSIPCMELGSI